MRKLLLALTLTILSACSQAPPPASLVSKDVFALGYNDADDAARAGIRAAVASSSQFERGGGVLQGTDGKFYYTLPVGGKDTGEVKFGVQFNEKLFKLVAVYHTHPRECPDVCADDVTEYFSATDVQTAQELHVVSYIGILKTHSISKFIPEKDPLETVDANKGDGSSENVSLGEEVGFF
jgi:hypothetical protein